MAIVISASHSVCFLIELTPFRGKVVATSGAGGGGLQGRLCRGGRRRARWPRGLDPFHVLGHSGAGWLALEYAAKPPEGLPGCRSFQVTVVRVASSPGGAGRSVAAGRVLFGVPSGRADVCDLTVGGSSGVVPAALSFAGEDMP